MLAREFSPRHGRRHHHYVKVFCLLLKMEICGPPSLAFLLHPRHPLLHITSMPPLPFCFLDTGGRDYIWRSHIIHLCDFIWGYEFFFFLFSNFRGKILIYVLKTPVKYVMNRKKLLCMKICVLFNLYWVLVLFNLIIYSYNTY